MKSEMRVLLVEDNPGDARLIETMIAESISFSCRVQKVESLSQARKAIDDGSFDVIILDLGLQDSQGIETFETMNQIAPTIAIVVLTSLSDDEVALMAVQKGAQDYLIKGEIDIRSLTRSLRYAVERKRAQMDLAKSKALLCETGKIGKIGGWTFDAETLTQTWTEEIFRILEIDPNNGEPMVPEGVGFITPAYRPMAEQAIQRAIEFGEPFDQEWEIITAKGNKRWVRAVSTTYQEKGKTKSVSGSFQDITDRKRGEEALRQAKDELEVRVAQRTSELSETNIQLEEEREKLAVMLRSIGDGVIATDEHGTVILINQVAEELTGWSNTDAIGLPLNKVFHIVDESTTEECLDFVEKVISSGNTIGIPNQTSLITKDGQVKSIADSGSPIWDKNGRILGVIIVFRDITAQRIIEEEAEKSHRLESIGLLAGGIAHDFNNILTGILGDISLAKLYVKPGDKVHERLSDAEITLSHAKGLAHQLLTFSKGGAPVKRGTSIESLLNDSVNFALSGSNVRHLIEIDPDVWPVDVDNIQMVQVFNNILINAREAMPNGGIVYLRGENVPTGRGGINAALPKDQDFVMISFTDNGKGISQANLSRVFDPYFTTKSQGGGLGLAIVYSIIKRHDGFISLESEEGKGAKFMIFLPAGKQPMVKKLPSYEELPLGHERVLLMDDQEFILEITGEILTALGYQVEKAEDGEKAIELFKRAKRCGEPFDMIILDLTIPGGMGGKEAMQKIRALDPKVRSIVSSGYSNDPVMSEPEKFGFMGAVGKPYTVRELHAEIHRVLQLNTA